MAAVVSLSLRGVSESAGRAGVGTGAVSSPRGDSVLQHTPEML